MDVCLGARSGRGAVFSSGPRTVCAWGKREVLMYGKCALGVQNPGKDLKRMRWSCWSAPGPGPPQTGCRKKVWSALGPGRLPLGWQKKFCSALGPGPRPRGWRKKVCSAPGPVLPPWGGRKFFVRRLSPEPPLWGVGKNFSSALGPGPPLGWRKIWWWAGCGPSPGVSGKNMVGAWARTPPGVSGKDVFGGEKLSIGELFGVRATFGVDFGLSNCCRSQDCGDGCWTLGAPAKNGDGDGEPTRRGLGKKVVGGPELLPGWGTTNCLVLLGCFGGRAIPPRWRMGGSGDPQHQAQQEQRCNKKHMAQPGDQGLVRVAVACYRGHLSNASGIPRPCANRIQEGRLQCGAPNFSVSGVSVCVQRLVGGRCPKCLGLLQNPHGPKKRRSLMSGWRVEGVLCKTARFPGAQSLGVKSL